MGLLELAYPFRGRWLTQNSPANRVPSHGTARFALAHSIDLVPVDEHGRGAPLRLTSLLRPEVPEAFPGFGRMLLSPADAVVLAVHDGEEDHPAHRGLPSIGYALSQGRRAAAGFAALAGNHVLLRVQHRGQEGGDDNESRGSSTAVVALCHLRRGSLRVERGQRVSVGDPLGACGNSGNSTQPHLHLQAMTVADPAAARAVPFTFPGGLPRNGQILEIP